MKKILVPTVLVFFIIVAFAVPVFSVSDEDCLDCHLDSDIEMEKNGKTISLHVKKNELRKSVHAKVSCIQCHAGFDPEEVPHKENIESINCMNCHKNIYNKHKFHPKMKMTSNTDSELMNCKNCHGTHKILSSKRKTSKTNYLYSTEFCGKCHKEEKEQHLKSEHYVQFNIDSHISPTCIYCHNKPITNGAESEMLKLKINQEKLCLSCHLSNSDNQTQYSKSLVRHEKSVHGERLLSGNHKAAVCIDCHGVHDIEKASSKNSTINRFGIPDVCGKCHISITQEYEISIHGVLLKQGNQDVPGCTFCHSEHDIAPIPNIPAQVFTENQINESIFIENKMVYCIVCHVDKKMMDKYKLRTIQKAHEWLPNQAVHLEIVRCVDCHSSYVPPNLSHNILPPEKTVKECEECHSQNSILMTKLYKHDIEIYREKFGFVNGTILSDAYVIGTTRNLLLDTLSLIIFGFTILGIGLHILLRWYFNRVGKIK